MSNCSKCSQGNYNTLNYYYDASCHPQFRDGIGNPASKLVEIRQPILVETRENYQPCSEIPINKYMRCKKTRTNCKQYIIP